MLRLHMYCSDWRKLDDVEWDVTETITDEQKRILETPVDGMLRKIPYGAEIYLEGEWRQCQSRVHFEDLEGYILEDKMELNWPKLILPMEDKG